jgi:S1-C subfamily serine protease
MKTVFYKNITLFLFLLILSACSSNQLLYDGNEIAPTYSETDSKKYMPIKQSNDNLDFYNFISGISSVIILTEEKLEITLDNDEQFYRKYQKLIKNYLSGIGVKNIAVSVDEKNWIENNIPFEKSAHLKITLDNTKNYISKINMIFKSCNGDEFVFSINSDYYIDKEWDNLLLNKMKEMYWHTVNYNPENSLKLKKEMTQWNLNSLKKYFSENSIDGLEGIYEKYGTGIIKNESKYRIALIKESENYNIIYLKGANKSNNWSEGELKGTISKSSIKDFYKVKWIMSDKSLNEDVYLTTTKYNFLEFDFLESEFGFKTKYLKMYPNVSNEIESSDNYISSGTGFFISNDGYLVTNHHIVRDAKNLSVQIKSENGLKDYKAEIVSDDKKNDLTILKISNTDFQFNNEIPFLINGNEFPIGTSVYTLGYPMIETMGESIKLSDGIISSNSGYMSNSSVYQVTVPINPGNSGGPLFDKDGNLVGIINAKYSGAENVTYAIKSKYLLEMLHEANLNTSNPKAQQLQNLSLVDQVEILDNLVCLIKVYN